MSRLRLSVLAAAMLVSAGVHAGEIEFWHFNDLFAGSDRNDDLYSATIGIGGTHKSWNIAFEEHMFTDKLLNARHDESYLTVARQLLDEESAWSVRAELGIAHIGEGLFGEDFQNFVHEITNQPEVDLPYSTDERTEIFANLLAGRTVIRRPRFSLTPEIELEYTGFKRHARASLRAGWDLQREVGVFVDGGFRWSETNYPTLIPNIDPSAPAYGLGVRYKRLIEFRWSENHYGVGGRHLHLTLRFQVGRGRDSRPAG